MAWQAILGAKTIYDEGATLYKQGHAAYNQVSDVVEAFNNAASTRTAFHRRHQRRLLGQRSTDIRRESRNAVRAQRLLNLHRERSRRKNNLTVHRATGLSMARSRRRPPRRRSGAKRKRRVSFKRRKTKRARFSRGRGRRRPMRRSHLRLFPGGVPKTRTIKLRVMKQCRVTPRGGKWGAIYFRPASMFNPFESIGALETSIAPETTVVTIHEKLLFTFKDGGVGATRPQPYGYDYWLSNLAGGAGQYSRYEVLGSSTKIIMTPDTGALGGRNFYAGFNKNLYGQHDSAVGDQDRRTDLLTFYQKFKNIDDEEISDMLNNKIIDKPTIIQAGGSLSSGRSTTLGAAFEFNFSQRKHKALRRRNGQPAMWDAANTGTSVYTGTHGAAPDYNPYCYFIIGDVGDTTSTPAAMPCMIVIDYTVRLSDIQMLDESANG